MKKMLKPIQAIYNSLYDSCLSKYKDKDYLTQSKARFIYKTYVFMVIFIWIIITSTLIIEYYFLDSFDYPTIILEFLAFVFIGTAFLILGSGKLELSIHFILVTLLFSIWLIIIVDKNDMLTRYDTISYTYVIMMITSLISIKSKTTVFIYTLINLLLLSFFTYYAHHTSRMQTAEIIDYFIDNSLAFLLCGIIAYNIQTIYKSSIDRSETALKSLMQTEAEIKKINADLESTVAERTSELHGALKTIEEANLELKTLNENLAVETENLLVLNDKLALSEKELRLANKTKDKFFSIIAHDLRNPIGGIRNLLETLYLHNHNMTPREAENMIAALYKASETTFELLDNLLQWSLSQTSRIEFNPTFNNVFSFLDKNINLLRTFADSKNISFQLNCPKETIAFFDTYLSSTVIRNLLTNSVKYSFENSCISVNASVIHNGESESFVQIIVSDKGQGMSSELLDSLFQIDRLKSIPGTKNEKGTGLGLILCKEFIEIQNGRIWCESTEGKGSSFYFILPMNG